MNPVAGTFACRTALAPALGARTGRPGLRGSCLAPVAELAPRADAAAPVGEAGVPPPDRRVTELRIHGVSGTPPESMLQHPHVRLVAGDKKAGFYRRWFPDGESAEASQPEREAYSWGGLTSGAGSRALWLLLLPFALVNLASWTEPGDPNTALGRRRVLEALLRLFAITLTLTFVLAIATMSMDLLAWQCAVPDSRCAEQDGLAERLASLETGPGRRLALASLVPAVVVLLFWYLGHSTWRRYEAEPMPKGAGKRDFSLADPRFWNGDQPVQRLRALHICAAWALLALLVIDPTRELYDVARPRLATASLMVELLAALIGLACLVLSLYRNLGDRVMAEDKPVAKSGSFILWRTLPWLGLVMFAVAVALAAGPHTPEWTGVGPMPLLSGLLHTGFCIQALLLLALLGLNSRLPKGPPQPVAIAVRGHALPLLATIGWLLAGGFAAGLAVRAAEWLGEPVADVQGRNEALAKQVVSPQAGGTGGGSDLDPLREQLVALASPDPLFVPAPFTWVALIAALLAIFVLPVLLAATVLRLKRLTRKHTELVEQRRRSEFPDLAPEPVRAKAVGRARALAELSDYAPRYLGRAVLAASLLVVVGIISYALSYAFGDRSWPQKNLPILTGFGSWAMGAIALGLVALGRAAYRTPTLRRTVGILWDVASFWPRAAHPLAPPCYSERVLPDLQRRSTALTRNESDRLLISAHSQGTVIALALVLQLQEQAARRCALLTYGSPLTRLYASFFPGYVNRQAYESAAVRLGAEAGSTTRWPWRNLYRLTDPIGGPVLAADADDVDDIDQELADPVFDRAAGDPAWPPTHGHSDYWLDEKFDVVRKRVLELRE